MTDHAPSNRNNRPPITLDNEVVLVVDDSPETLGMLNEALELAGLSVLIALEGKQALTIAEKITPDIILLDAIMPKMDGFETCRRLKANPKLAEIPVIFMTGLSDTESIIKGLDVGSVDYLTKPINPDELLARMRVHLTNARRTSSAHTALDTTGQYLFTVDSSAILQWATPQTRHLFSLAKVSEDWLYGEMANQLREWLNHKPKQGQAMHLKGLEHPLDVRLIEKSNNQQFLLKLIDATAPSGAAKLKVDLPITERESEVLYWIGNGKTNREIGQILDTSPRTVNKHLEQIFRKLEVDNRTSAAAIAIKIMTED
jgi:DNA-binding NarL/FixJ family response regulator